MKVARKRKPKAKPWSAAAALDDEIAARLDAMADTDDGEPDERTALLDIVNNPRRGDTPRERAQWRAIMTRVHERLTFDNLRRTLIAVAAEHGRQSEPDHEIGDLIDLFNACWRRLSPKAKAEVSTEFSGLIAAWPVRDVVATNHGTIVSLQPRTDAGRDWFAEHLAHAMRMPDGSVVVEHAYVGPILEGLDADGLTVEGVSLVD